MASIMDRLFPARKPRTSAAVSARLAAARDALADAQVRLADAADRRDAAPLANDRVGFLATAERDLEDERERNRYFPVPAPSTRPAEPSLGRA